MSRETVSVQRQSRSDRACHCYHKRQASVSGINGQGRARHFYHKRQARVSGINGSGRAREWNRESFLWISRCAESRRLVSVDTPSCTFIRGQRERRIDAQRGRNWPVAVLRLPTGRVLGCPSRGEDLVRNVEMDPPVGN